MTKTSAFRARSPGCGREAAASATPRARPSAGRAGGRGDVAATGREGRGRDRRARERVHRGDVLVRRGAALVLGPLRRRRPAQRRLHRARILPPRRRAGLFPLKGAVDDRRELRRHVGCQEPKIRRRLRDRSHEDLRDRPAPVHAAPGEQREHGRAHRPEVSLRASTSSHRPRACSGGMYAAVPISAPMTVAPSSATFPSRSRAIPKSRSLTSPPRVKNTFSGFRSRCTMPCACAEASVARTWSIAPTTSATGSRPPVDRCRRASSVSPSSSSITRNAAPSSVTSSSSTATAPRPTLLAT